MTKVPKPMDGTAAYTLVYDAWNRLTSVSDGDTLAATCMYDARNHRIKTTVGTTVTFKYFNRNWQEVESVAAGVTTTYVYGLRYVDDILCRTSGSETLYALQDPNWNVVALVNTSSTVAERLTYDSFGKPTFRSANFTAKTASSYNWTKTFTGQVYDTETGLMLYRNRYYHPTLGRFITRDPVGYRGDSVNLYRYVRNVSINYLDTFGLEKTTTFGLDPEDLDCNCPLRFRTYLGHTHEVVDLLIDKKYLYGYKWGGYGVDGIQSIPEEGHWKDKDGNNRIPGNTLIGVGACYAGTLLQNVADECVYVRGDDKPLMKKDLPNRLMVLREAERAQVNIYCKACRDEPNNKIFVQFNCSKEVKRDLGGCSKDMRLSKDRRDICRETLNVCKKSVATTCARYRR